MYCQMLYYPSAESLSDPEVAVQWTLHRSSYLSAGNNVICDSTSAIAIPPHPHGGDRPFDKKAQAILVTEGAKDKFSLRHIRTAALLVLPLCGATPPYGDMWCAGHRWQAHVSTTKASSVVP